ncbi:MAG: hypothetical protein COW00_19620 [Bdellovibrio sp. CG12_big_fil_rev_8_21_14_0_65_39_13]|nr:MAG: hypothetical protein COW78_02900 [Bdellovibrio sp. CG22_combo_CG10-13_8_21_14_all_39_27]PIQ57668.1 MAG: hypothetical protein COW00_19620 [Bdellovibrio sp. CG12_big_fil_rev_8_21_14_0_65_39_13]PIR35082.1 MAG: hypothetical protein COV37_10685 [Bdellovibrio sp. CG11_big_fil_rev_8_21_14_0_20_39_38]
MNLKLVTFLISFISLSAFADLPTECGPLFQDNINLVATDINAYTAKMSQLETSHLEALNSCLIVRMAQQQNFFNEKAFENLVSLGVALDDLGPGGNLYTHIGPFWAYGRTRSIMSESSRSQIFSKLVLSLAKATDSQHYRVLRVFIDSIQTLDLDELYKMVNGGLKIKFSNEFLSSFQNISSVIESLGLGLFQNYDSNLKEKSQLIFDFFAQKGINANYKTAMSKSPFDLCNKMNYDNNKVYLLKLAKLVLEQGGDPKFRLENGFQPYEDAVDNNMPELVDLYDSIINEQSQDGGLNDNWFNSAKNGDLEILKSLLDKVDINIQNDLGETALIVAASMGQLEVVKCLIQNGADKDVTDMFGSSAYDMAKLNGHILVVQYFEKL